MRLIPARSATLPGCSRSSNPCYPAGASSGDAIRGLGAVPPGADVFHAGTAERDGEIVTAGGRVLGVTALGETRAAARAAAYAAADVIAFDGAQRREDIAA